MGWHVMSLSLAVGEVHGLAEWHLAMAASLMSQLTLLPK